MSNPSPELIQAKSYFANTYSQLLQMEEKDLDLKPVIASIEDFVQNEGRGITTSQLRNIYAKVKSHRQDEWQKLQLMRPLLAYTAARQGTRQARVIIALLDDLIQQVNEEKHLEGFLTFMESIVAYHKFHHPK